MWCGGRGGGDSERCHGLSWGYCSEGVPPPLVTAVPKEGVWFPEDRESIVRTAELGAGGDGWGGNQG